MSDRCYLSGSILLGDVSDGSLYKRTFEIDKILNEGASAVCYEAHHEKSGRGVLKEFYPQELFPLERDEEGQLICSTELSDMVDRFHKAEDKYLEPYHMLLNAKKDSSLRHLGTFIPPFEIYHGCSKSGDLVGTTYIWTPDPELETFAEVCEEIHAHPAESPEHKLVTALLAIDSLTECVCELHKAAMLHRDIKPSNFGFDRRGSQTLTQTLTMFDINSICSVFSDFNGTIGSEGYLEPEAGYKSPTNQTDIYSIGATLFHAIIITEETKSNHYTYENEFYAKIEDMVRDSELIAASEANSHPRLRSILAKILKMSLCPRSFRYSSCEALLKDLKAALYYALPSDIAQQGVTPEKWVLSDMEKALDVNKEKNSFLAIQYHLYSHPLYHYCTDADGSINVLLLGFGNYGQKFLDACLQNGQVRNKQLHVTVISDDSPDKKNSSGKGKGDLSDKAIYLGDRPELPKFFNVDGSLSGRSDSYGDVVFQTSELFRQVPDTDVASFQSIISEYCMTRHPHYVFIALGSDPLNQKAADSCGALFKNLQIECIISYISERGRATASKAADIRPIYVNEDLKGNTLYAEVERMAFNTNLVWEKDLNVEFSSIREHFRKPYNHDSSVSSVLALASKLYSIGIDLRTTSFSDAALRFNEIMNDKANKTIKNELIWIEHRRRVTEKICRGWRPIEKLTDCSTGLTKDEKRKRHVCLVRSRADQMLAESQKVGRFYMWDNAKTAELDDLDDMDRMSVELHRMFKRYAAEAKKQDLLTGSTMDSIRSLIEGNRTAIVAYQEWLSCLKGIWHNDTSQARLYKGLCASFLSAADTLPVEKRSAVKDLVKAFDATFYPIRAAMEYRDWKKDDVEFINNIPFILTYTEDAYLVIPFVTGDSKAIFSNVAAATVVNPARILFLYLIDADHSIDTFRESLPLVLNYMRKKHFKAAVDLILLAEKTAVSATELSDAQGDLLANGDGRIRRITPIIGDNEDSMLNDLVSYLKQRSAGKNFFAVERNATGLTYLLKGAKVFDTFGSYYFHSDTMTFESSSPNCEMLNYIVKAPYITVSDMAAFQLSSSVSSNQPEFFRDYKELWNKYKENKDLWKRLCTLLGAYSEKSDIIATFKEVFARNRSSTPAVYYYIVPSACNRTVSKIIRFFVAKKFLDEGSRVVGLSSDSCEIRIIDSCGYRFFFDRLFSKIYYLMSPDDISLHYNPKTYEIVVTFDNLVVKGLSPIDTQLSDFIDLMNYFKDKSYVTNLIIKDNCMSFTYGSKQIKSLLTTAGKMLEVHTYHKSKELGWFDDIVSSYELNWGDEELKNEFDCILTKGFRTLFVECKARLDLEQEFYFKISRLAEKFGINATAVLIADTQEKSGYGIAPVNVLQRKRGQKMDVVTIWKPEDIQNIGHTLVKVMKGNYSNDVD